MNHQQIIENMLNFSMQQHVLKDQTIEGLQKRIAELEKELEKRPIVLETSPNSN